jgi:hypothetical protein
MEQNKFKEFLTNTILNNIGRLISGLGIILLPILYYLHDSIQSLVIHKDTQSLISWIVLVLIWLFLLESLTLLFIHSRKKIAFGLYWDKHYNAYCPICKTLCSYTHYLERDYGIFHCPKCDKIIIPTTSKGGQLTYEQVINSFKDNLEK